MSYFSDICRICMLKNVKLINIYHSDDDMITYIDKLNTCIPEIFAADNYVPLPDQICELCCKNLKIVFWFRELCLKSNSLLRSYYSKLEGDFKHNGDTNHRKENVARIKQENGENKLNFDTNNIPFEFKDYLDIRIKSEGSDSDISDTEYFSKYPKIEISTFEDDKFNSVHTESDYHEVDENNSSNSVGISEIVHQPFCLQTPLERTSQFDSDLLEKHRHICSFCGKVFKYRQDMRVHERIHTGINPYSCQFCPKTFAKSTRLKLHLNTHTREKTFNCKICNKIFKQNSNLAVHLKLHAQSDRFHCHLCEKSFSQKRHLKQHILFHENERRFTCEVCNWSFGMKHHLKRHLMTHSGQRPPRKDLPSERDRPFACDQCDWSFMSKEVLKKHLNIHTKDNPKIRASLSDKKRKFSCPKCIWSFTKKHHLKRHMVKHENRVFVCKTCNKDFRKNYELQRHVKLAHCEQSTVNQTI